MPKSHLLPEPVGTLDLTRAEIDPAFVEHVGMRSPIPLRVEHSDAGVLAEGEIDRPFAVVGAHAACEIALNDAALAARVACVQVLDGHLWVVPFDTLMPTRATADSPFRVGKFRVYRTDTTAPLAPIHNPRREDLPKGTPLAWVTVLNGPATGERVYLNRRMTFVGSAAVCDVRVTPDEVDPVHAYLVVTADAVWVVDLRSGSGTWVNEQPVRAVRLTDGDELRIGKTRLGCRFDLWGDIDTDESTVGEKGFDEPAELVPLTPAPPSLPTLAPPPDANPTAVALFQYVAALQGHMMEQFRQSMDSMLETFSRAHTEHSEAMRRELTRMAELNAELHKLHLQAKAAPSPATALYKPVTEPAEDSANRHQWVAERLREIEAERAGVWTRIKAMFVRGVPGV